jgi:hypothetical protein
MNLLCKTITSSPQLISKEFEMIENIQKDKKKDNHGIYAQGDGLIQSLAIKYKYQKIGSRAAKVMPKIMSSFNKKE